MIKIIKDKSARLQKIFLILIIFLIILVPLTAQNETSNETQPLEGISEELVNETLVVENVSEIIEVSENETIDTTPQQPVENVSTQVNETNQTQEPSPELPEDQLPSDLEGALGIQPPKLDIEIIYDEKTTRGNEMVLKALISNLENEDVKDISIEWKLPRGFEIVQGNQKETIERIVSEEGYESEITIKTSFTTSLGINKIKMLVSY